VHLGRDCRRLLHLRLETAVVDPISGRVCHDDHVVYRPQRLGHVAGLCRSDVRGLLADEAGLLNARGTEILQQRNKVTKSGPTILFPGCFVVQQKNQKPQVTPVLEFFNERLTSLRQRSHSRVNGVLAEQLFDAQKLIVFRQTIAAAQ
jgi:hypothetical protein